MINVEYTDGAQESLYLIESLWQGSRTHHKNKSKYFADTYANKRFQDRVNELTDDSKAAMRVIVHLTRYLTQSQKVLHHHHYFYQ